MMPRGASLLAAAAAVALAAVLLAGTLGPASARTFPDPCFSCLEQPSCSLPEPKKGTEFSITVAGKPPPPRWVPPPPGLKLTPLLDELATKNRTFTLKYKDKAYMEVQGKLISLGRYVANKSSDLWHMFEPPKALLSKEFRRPNLRALVELRCKDSEMHDKLMRVIVNTDAANLIPIIMNITNTSTAPAPSPPPGAKYRRMPPPPPPPPLLSMELPAVNITYTFIIPTNRACGLPQCDVNPEPVPEGEFVIYKPPLRRQECPGTFLSVPTCKSGRDALDLAPLVNRLSDRQRWRISLAAGAAEAAPSAAASADDYVEPANVLGRPVLIQNVARAARMCASHLSTGSSKGCGPSAGAATVAHAGEQWVVERGPLSPEGGLARLFYFRAQALADAGCERSYLCLNLSCNATSALQLCSKDEPGYSTTWLLRSTDINAMLSRKWGLA